LTGVQAFLRDELLAFCREAPPEFNEHQRDVFCVFSGNGVARLRDFLNEQKTHAANSGSVTSSVVDDSDMIDVDMDDNNPDSDGSNTPIVNVDVHGNASIDPGQVSSNVPYPPVPPMHHGTDHHGLGFSILSQSAPATTGGVMWADDNTHTVHNQGASHVTGMLGATILDEGEGDVDDTFGEGSDTMGD
jgi:F-box and leucine-rich repeat protein GRR1